MARQADDATRFTDNFTRLLGMHGLSQHFAAQVLGVSAATMSAWMNGKATPSLSRAIAISELFEIPTQRLMGAEFVELLDQELADPERFKRVEARIQRKARPLKAV
jgi:transcriptional regulator with XRE-family HTH domain